MQFLVRKKNHFQESAFESGLEIQIAMKKKNSQRDDIINNKERFGNRELKISVVK